ncbi:hypothetical protein Vretifemale_17776 [Volvox reticuliferus]|nr:hypothetical protein Vretifemale_17776 [Volvox reticuliferus]
MIKRYDLTWSQLTAAHPVHTCALFSRSCSVVMRGAKRTPPRGLPTTSREKDVRPVLERASVLRLIPDCRLPTGCGPAPSASAPLPPPPDTNAARRLLAVVLLLVRCTTSTAAASVVTAASAPPASTTAAAVMAAIAASPAAVHPAGVGKARVEPLC